MELTSKTYSVLELPRYTMKQNEQLQEDLMSKFYFIIADHDANVCLTYVRN